MDEHWLALNKHLEEFLQLAQRTASQQGLAIHDCRKPQRLKGSEPRPAKEKPSMFGRHTAVQRRINFDKGSAFWAGSLSTNGEGPQEPLTGTSVYCGAKSSGTRTIV